ncbi:MAG: 5'/3'-nucleotidase SurE [Alphaproteobacteria bacterium]|nr:5'/3'-nucleotidase SurE [Alphaproteobacteria bacterium]MDE2631044.1 5'/3'-nucleotidase SurE [Alphaproteobacteria bacterium]
MRILVTNDDGIHSRGLQVAEAIARALTDDVWVIAPETEQSGASHSLTLSRPLRMRKADARHFSVTGTPTDCVMMATTHVMKDALPTLVLSGVNRGVNAADDVTYSGTIAGAMEGCALDIPSIALSQAYNFEEKREIQWACAGTHGPDLIRKLIGIGWPKDVFINVNFPDCAPGEVEGVEIVAQGKRELQEAVIDKRIDMRGYPYFWIGFRRERVSAKPGTDLGALYAKKISVTPLQLNLTETAVMEALKRSFAG